MGLYSFSLNDFWLPGFHPTQRKRTFYEVTRTMQEKYASKYMYAVNARKYIRLRWLGGLVVNKLSPINAVVLRWARLVHGW